VRRSVEVERAFAREILPAVDRSDRAGLAAAHDRVEAIVVEMIRAVDHLGDYFERRSRGTAAAAERVHGLTLGFALALVAVGLAASAAIVRGVWRAVASPLLRSSIASRRERAPDVVVCDLRMPDGDGLEVLRAVRGLGLRCPFILMTAYATVPTAVQAMREGAYDYITKPFDPDELRILVLRAVAEAGVRAGGDEGAPHARPSAPPQEGAIASPGWPAGARLCASSSASSSGWRPPTPRCWSSGRRAPARNSSPARSTTGPHAPRSAAWPSTAPRSRAGCWRASSSSPRGTGSTPRGCPPRFVEASLTLHRGNASAAAHHAGIERESFHRLLRRHDLRAEQFREDGRDAPRDDDGDP